jgi:catechol-2,3-dioxygenase
MPSPIRFSHVVLQTNQIGVLRDWYCAMLDGTVVYQNDAICFITFDEEHHRIALIDPGGLAHRSGAGSDPLRAGGDTGLHHFAYAFKGLGDLVEVYEGAKARSVLPYWCINHGPTTSMYYRDPDGNRIEMFVDNFPTMRECKAYMEGPAFAKNPLGVEFDPEKLAARFRAGVPAAELLAIPE